MEYDVFLSYSSKDAVTAEILCSALESNGIKCWIAPRDISPGKQWGGAILDGISQCKLFVLIFSSNSNCSDQVIREVDRAVHKGLIIIPFRIEDTLPTGTMEYYLSTTHWMDAITPTLKQHVYKLIELAWRNLDENRFTDRNIYLDNSLFEDNGTPVEPKIGEPHTRDLQSLVNEFQTNFIFSEENTEAILIQEKVTWESGCGWDEYEDYYYYFNIDSFIQDIEGFLKSRKENGTIVLNGERAIRKTELDGGFFAGNEWFDRTPVKAHMNIDMVEKKMILEN